MFPLLLSDRTRKVLKWTLPLLVVVRVLCIFFVPLTDTTEARYAEIARKMLETGNWITPLHNYGVPFWAKPPLSTWLSAASMGLFGINEFAVRLPSLLLSIATVALLWQWLAPRRGRDYALLACAILASGMLFFSSAGAVLTDPSLTLSTTAAMVTFWQALHTQQRRWGYLFFAAIGFGLLAKGPLAAVLTLLPTAAWVIWRGQWRAALAALPWFGGTLLLLAIALPWYITAEIKTPGFLQYFIVGEHIQRFIYPDWRGDRYGNAHHEPLGMIWPFWLQATFPWSLLLLAWLIAQRRRARALLADDDGWCAYLVIWALTTPLFFTAAQNVIWTYVMPALPAFAVLAVELYSRGQRVRPLPIGARTLAGACAIVPAGVLAMALLHHTPYETYVKSSCKELVQMYFARRPSAESQLFTFKRRYYSAEFYTAGRAQPVYSAGGVAALLRNGSVDFLAIHDEEWLALSPMLRARFKPLGRFDGQQLLQELPDPRAAANFR